MRTPTVCSRFVFVLAFALFASSYGYAASQGTAGYPGWSPDALIMLKIEQDYGKAQDYEGLPVRELVERIAGYFGLGISIYNEEYDALLRIEIEGKPLGANYRDASGKHRYYTGAELDVDMSFKPRKGRGSHFEVSEVEPPMDSIEFYGDSPPASPSDAPFDMVYSFCKPEIAEAIFVSFYRFLKGYGEAGESFAISAMVAALADGDPSICEAARGALEGIDPNWTERREAKEAVGLLIARLADESWSVRKAAAEALGEIGDPRAVRPLQERLLDEDQLVREAAQKALTKMGIEASAPIQAGVDEEECVDLETLMTSSEASVAVASASGAIPAPPVPAADEDEEAVNIENLMAPEHGQAEAEAGSRSPAPEREAVSNPPKEEETVDLENLMASTEQAGSKEATKNDRAVEKSALPPEPSQAASLDGNAIREVFQKSYRGRVELCYARGLERNPQLAGEVVIRFTIGLDGRVISAEVVHSTLPDKKVVNCIRRRFLVMRFPAPTGAPVTVNYKLYFKP